MSKVSRRDLFKAAAGMGLGVALPGTSQAAGGGQGGGGDDATDLVFVNGRIHTMDERNPLVSAVAIRDGKFISVGNAAHPGGNARVINLRGPPASSVARRRSSIMM